jgi:NAD+ diphosphatase
VGGTGGGTVSVPVAGDPGMTEPEGGWALTGLALARGDLDRVAHRRGDEEWLAAAWADPRTRVLVVTGGKAPVRFAPDGAELVLVPPAQAPDGTRLLLGVDETAAAYFAVVTGGPELWLPPDPAPPAGGEVRAAGLREAGPLLGDRHAGLFTHAVALANWHGSHTHCPRCGAPTRPAEAGHIRVCTADGSEHFPRTDPAVIMVVADDAGRILLARNRRWPERRVSILAGFVEPGESAEQAVAREVAEETGIAVTDIRYLGSQPWPMPQSLMLGFRSRAAAGQRIRVDDKEIAEARWFSRDDLRAAIADRDVLLPPPVSIAHRIIEAWYGEPLPRAW